LSESKPTAAFVTFGCKVNQYDTQAMAEALRDIGYDINPVASGADLYVVNTCTVTRASDAKARKAIRALHRFTPESHIFVTGCYAQAAKSELLEIDGVTNVFGNREKSELKEMIRDAEVTQTLSREFVGDPDAQVDLGEFGLSIATFDEQTRAMVKVQDGCSAFCTFCIIPHVRGRMRSRDLPDIVAEVERLAARGFREAVITGVQLGSYGRDLRRRWDLADVLRALHEVDGIARIRLSSIEPMDVPSNLIRAVSELPKVARHFHIPLQSGSTAVLDRMRRKYTQEGFLDLVTALYDEMPDVGLTTDVMVGFPGETEAEFEDTYRVVEKSAFHRLHVFRYSPREGTPAAAYTDQVPPAVAIARSKAVRELGKRLERQYQDASVGSLGDVMIENGREGPREELAGYTGNYLRVLTDAHDADRGTLRRVELVGVEDGYMRGRLAAHEG
jgi:threonylcarbamoyladenosine tRNA methylthiotransferase MtaB